MIADAEFEEHLLEELRQFLLAHKIETVTDCDYVTIDDDTRYCFLSGRYIIRRVMSGNYVKTSTFRIHLLDGKLECDLGFIQELSSPTVFEDLVVFLADYELESALDF